MDVAAVRGKFQKEIDFFISDYVPDNINHLRYSLQQDSTKMRFIHLYITSEVDPKLEGKHIRIKNQDYLVYKSINEPFSFKEWTYKLLVLSECIEIKELMAESNSIGGSTMIITDGKDFKIDGNSLKVINGSYLVFLQDRISNDEGEQPIIASELTMLLPLSSPLKSNKNYEILYKGVKHKLKNISVSFGAWVLKVVKDI